MKILVNAVVVSIEAERTSTTKEGKTINFCTAVLEVGRGDDYICADVSGKDRIAVIKQKQAAGKPVELVLSLTGAIKKPGFWGNNLYVKWILS